MKKINVLMSDPSRRANIEARFWPKVRKAGDDECWEWIAKARHPFGYGRMTTGRGNQIRAHQVAYVLSNGAIPEGQNVLHSCDNPPCCNPRHLFLGTQKENTMDMKAKGRGSNPPTHYGEEHPRAKFSEADVRRILADKRPAKIIAAEYGVTPKTIYCLRRGDTWKKLFHTENPA
jgi:hypothetical protein